MKKLYYANIPGDGLYIVEANNQGSAYTYIQDIFYSVKKEDIKELEFNSTLFTLENGSQVIVQKVQEDTIESVTRELRELELQEAQFGSLYVPVNIKIAIAKKKEKLRKLSEQA